MKFTSKELLISFILIIIFIGIVELVIPFDNFRRNDFFVLSTFTLNGFLWILLLLSEVKKRSFSLAFMHWSFCLLFFFFAALVQYTNNKFPWINYRDDDSILTTNIVLLIWTICVIIGNRLINIKKYLNSKYFNENLAFSRIIKINLVSLAVISFWRIYNVGLLNLLSRATSSYAVSENASIGMLITHMVEALAYFSCLACMLAYKFERKSVIYAVLAFIMILISYPPTGLARYEAAAIYLGLILTISDYIKKSRVFVIIFLMGFLLVLPFLNAFRIVAFSSISIAQIFHNVLSNISTLWLAGDYDAYTMVTLAIDYIDDNGITWGYQAIGSVLFWIPRTLWISKPVGSGAEIADALGWQFTNLACPLPAEGIINFSFLGVIIFALVVGSLMRFFDELYWRKCFEINKINFLYPVTVMFFFFMNRGDFMSSFAYMSAFIVVGIIYMEMVCLFNKINLR